MAWIENKCVVITGATSGIGKEIAIRLALLGAHTVLACRDRQLGNVIAADINAKTQPRRAVAMTINTADQRSIRAFASDYYDRYGCLDVLVNNAGVLVPSRQTNADHVELTFATNVLGYFLTTLELLDALTTGTPSRVVNVASTFASDVELGDLQFQRRPYSGMTAYAQSKACDRMLTWAFARRLRETPVTVNAMAPGLVLDTKLYRHLSPEAKRGLEQFGTRTVSAGAETAIWLASSPELSGVTDRFFEQHAEIPCQFRDEDAQDSLWQACEQLTRQLKSEQTA